jgi:hypothetical protein
MIKKDEKLSPRINPLYDRSKKKLINFFFSTFTDKSKGVSHNQDMVYGILLESIVRNFILDKYDKILLQEIEEYIQHPLSHLNLFALYDDNLMLGIAEGMRLFLFP